jgi:all-trans-retinol 13,14-reductase
MNVVIIGAGVSGLTAGSHLAKAGHQVTVFEQYRRPGGVTAPFERDGYRWDLGQLLIEGLGPDEPLGLILEELGVADRINAIVDDRGYVFPDFEVVKPTEYGGTQWRIALLKEIFPEESTGLDRYWTDYVRFTSLMTAARRMDRASGLSAWYWKIGLLFRLLPLFSRRNWSAQQIVDDYFTSQRLKLVFTSILADFFTAPKELLGLGVYALNPEPSFDKRMPAQLAKGAVQLYYYSVLGGISKLANALAEYIEARGGTIQTGRPIAHIRVENKRATGVIDDRGSFTSADVVIASGGAKETFLKLIGEERLAPEFANKVRTIPLMESVFMVHLGIDYDPSPYVHGVCTYYYGTYDIDRAIADGRNGVYHEGRDGFVVHIPTLHTPEMAPEGHHAVTIYTICPDKLRVGDWDAKKEDYADKLIACAEEHIPELGKHITVRHILTPADFRSRTHLDHHAFGGIAPVMGAWRVPHETPVEGLWFVGAQSESGGGVNNVIPGAYKVARRIAAAT